jgi:hypothetical protein
MANTTTIEPEYVYMTIPADYVCTYNKILVLLAKFGVDMLQSCQAACTKRNKNIIDCFNMFNAAVAARKLGQDKLAETIMKYINAQLKILNDNTEITPNIIFPVDENGYIKAVVSCGENPTFTVDAESGELWQQSQTNDLSGDFMLDSTDTASE